jgi:hypothetical protein
MFMNQKVQHCPNGNIAKIDVQVLFPLQRPQIFYFLILPVLSLNLSEN